MPRTDGRKPMMEEDRGGGGARAQVSMQSNQRTVSQSGGAFKFCPNNLGLLYIPITRGIGVIDMNFVIARKAGTGTVLGGWCWLLAQQHRSASRTSQHHHLTDMYLCTNQQPIDAHHHRCAASYSQPSITMDKTDLDVK